MQKLFGCLKNYIWGGEKLKKMYGRDACGIVAESWEVSVHSDGSSRTKSGTLAQYLQEHPFAVNPQGDALPVLIKYIDAAQNLSVQVHPDDVFAQKHENDNGKTEMWYVVQADEGAGIYCGFRRDTTKEEFLQSLANGTVEQLLNFIPAKCGDAFLIKAGTVHAICGGCVICEVQQSSNVTYRVYDYNRLGADGKPRPLHIEKALQVMNFCAYRDETHSHVSADCPDVTILTQCDYFCCKKLTLNGIFRSCNTKSFVAVNVVRGSGTINGERFVDGDSFFVDCGERLELNGTAEILLTSC